MCPHEGSTKTTPIPKINGRSHNAWHLIDHPDNAMYHLHSVDGLIVALRLAIEHMVEKTDGPELCHLAHVCVLAERELSMACEKLEDTLSEIIVHR